MKGIYNYERRDSVPQKLCAPAAERNKQAILEVLQQYVPQMVAKKTPIQCLEVASGTGQHVAHFAHNLPGTQWQPAEFDTNDFPSIQAYASELPNISEPVFIDASQSPDQWPLQGRAFDLVYCANMIHISPKACTPGLFTGAAAFLIKGGILVTYGPYAYGGTITPESNQRFDESLRSRDSEWGLRDIDDLQKIAGNVGLALEKIVDMPANNKTLIWRKV
ncbi:methyltransferase-like 26 [Neocloeon triangulifer]|uniref:methyltransferase-like 26 n=1 Tax=Neocloeon triangulifer TaxID=2078957 RepID=UPI00286EFFCD|nr:methyltransferase-like 26 [Neocloeon triangulifer]XP_059475999.1 methyltransferase-like 26 [Neocloeon triangulifer]